MHCIPEWWGSWRGSEYLDGCHGSGFLNGCQGYRSKLFRLLLLHAVVIHRAPKWGCWVYLGQPLWGMWLPALISCAQGLLLLLLQLNILLLHLVFNSYPWPEFHVFQLTITIILALSTYYIQMMRIYYKYVAILRLQTLCYCNDCDLIMDSLWYYCWIMTLLIPLRMYFTCNTRDNVGISHATLVTLSMNIGECHKPGWIIIFHPHQMTGFLHCAPQSVVQSSIL